jgi:hypothetical protein
MVYSSMVHVAGGEGGSTRHDDDGRPAPTCRRPVRGPAPARAMTIDTERLRELAAELSFWPATTDEADIERHREHLDAGGRRAQRGPVVDASQHPGSWTGGPTDTGKGLPASTHPRFTPDGTFLTTMTSTVH